MYSTVVCRASFRAVFGREPGRNSRRSAPKGQCAQAPPLPLVGPVGPQGGAAPAAAFMALQVDDSFGAALLVYTELVEEGLELSMHQSAQLVVRGMVCRGTKQAAQVVGEASALLCQTALPLLRDQGMHVPSI